MDEEYFDIEKLLQQTVGKADQTEMRKVMSELMNGRLAPLPPVESYIKALDPSKHDVMDSRKRPNKLVNIDPDSEDYGSTRTVNINSEDGIPEKHRIEEVARIAIALQRLIVTRAVGITFGNKVKYDAVRENATDKVLYDAVMRILKDNKEETLNRKVARQIYGLTECAECWYTVEGKDEHTNYSSKKTKFKVKVRVFSPQYGDTLYPYFNEDMDMTAFSRIYTKKMPDGKDRTFLETYTAEHYYLWMADGDKSTATTNNSWNLVEGYPKPNPFGKIPVVYGRQDEPDYAIVESIISRMEKLLSNFADTNDYHASPKIVVKGSVVGFCKKGEAGGILELTGDNADASYLAWNQAPESVKTEYEKLKELAHMLTQTPDLSWEAVKGLNVSGVALKLMFMDSVLKVKDKEEIWNDYLTRRVNVLKAIMANIDESLEESSKKLFIDPSIEPFLVVDEMEKANVQLSLTGNKQLKSRRSAMTDLGIDDVDAEIEEIENEEANDLMLEQGEPNDGSQEAYLQA